MRTHSADLHISVERKPLAGHRNQPPSGANPVVRSHLTRPNPEVSRKRNRRQLHHLFCMRAGKLLNLKIAPAAPPESQHSPETSSVTPPECPSQPAPQSLRVPRPSCRQLLRGQAANVA